MNKTDLSDFNSELLTEAAGVKIFMTPFTGKKMQQVAEEISYKGKLKITLVNKDGTGFSDTPCGFHLSKSKWDPYPWITRVESGTLADVAGLRAGDCLINIDNTDVLGLKIKNIADLIRDKDHVSDVNLFVWRHPDESEEENQTALALTGPLPEVARKLANATSGAVRMLECPVCLESSMPPVSQCVHGHIICAECRPRTARCPVCRVRLGQGRCLLADKLHKIFHDAFGGTDDDSNKTQVKDNNLFERLFGKNKKKQTLHTSSRNNGMFSKPRQLLLTKLFLGGLEKAASADNLPAVSEEKRDSPGTAQELDEHFSQRLCVHDRTKSASTGELSRERNQMHNVMPNDSNNSVNSSNTSLLSNTLNTPAWGGSADSVFSMNISCPLSRQTACKDVLTHGVLLEHLSRTHEVPQVHFYSKSVNLPFPLPFGIDAVYILHCGADLFFFQYEGETCWVAGAMRENNIWEWILNGHGEDGTEINFRRMVTSLEEPFVLPPEHIVLLPRSISLRKLKIELVEKREGLDV